MSTPNPTQFTFTVENPYSNENENYLSNNIITRLSSHDLFIVKEKAIENRLWTEKWKEIFYENDQQNLTNKLLQKRFWFKPWTWLRKNQVLTATAEQIQKVEDQQQFRLNKIASMQLVECICDLYLLGKSDEFESKLFQFLEQLTSEEMKHFQFAVWSSTNDHQRSSLSDYYRNFFLIEEISKQFLKHKSLEYWTG